MLSCFVSSAVPNMPSTPGPLTCVARVSTIKFVWLPTTYSGSSGSKGTYTVPLPPFVTRSKPWSKNWPNMVIHPLKDGDKPISGDRFIMPIVPFSLTVNPADVISRVSALNASVCEPVADVSAMYCACAAASSTGSTPAARMAAAAFFTN